MSPLFQFIHLEAYSRKSDKSGRSVHWVLDEAERKPGACPHVENPELPSVVYGCTIAEVRAAHDAACSSARTVTREGKAKAIRVDQKTLLTVVASHEVTPEECREDPEKRASYEAWERDTVKWLQGQYGDALKSVIRHEDEGRMHIHAYILRDDLKALEGHPGTAAKRLAKGAALADGKDAKAANGEGDKAYKAAMRAWQDSYWQAVGLPHGMARLGPGKRRLSRSEWQAEKAAAQSLKLARDMAADLKAKGADYVKRTKTMAAEKTRTIEAKLAAAAERERQAVALIEQATKCAAETDLLNERAKKRERQAAQILEKARSEAKAILKAAKERARAEARSIVDAAHIKAKEILTAGKLLRRFLDGFRASEIEQRAQEAAQRQMEEAKDQVKEVRSELCIERKARRDAEVRADTAMAAARDLGAQVQRLRNVLDARLSDQELTYRHR